MPTPTTPGTYFCTPYLLGISAIESFQCVQDGYNCYMYTDMYGNCMYCGTQYCTSGYLLYTEYPANSPVYYYRSNGVGSYYTTSYCAAGAFYCFYYPTVCITQLNNSYPNGCIYIEHNGSGGYCTGLYEYCNNGYLFDYEDSLNYSCGYFSDGTGYYYTGIFNYCSSGTCFCTSDYYLQLPPSGCPYCFGSYDVIADGSGNRFNCYDFSPQNQLIKTDYLSGCCINYLSDGTGYYLTCTIFCSGTILACSGLYVNINNQSIDNGFRYLISDGTGSCFYSYNFCSFGFSFLDLNSVNYLSDGTGYYYLTDLFPRNPLDVKINWDFSKTTKSKYNFCVVDASGDSILLCLNNLNSCFYEINSICETSICLFEANQNKSLFIEDSCAPFIYVRNLGPNNINLILSNQTGYVNFKECQIFNKINFSGQNLILKEKESIIFSLQVSDEGSHYCSNIIYPFGFFYEFKDVKDVNQLGSYPVCCAFDILNNKYFPTYLYSDICNLPIESGCIVETGYGFNYQKQLSFGENLKVDCFSNLEISLQKATGTGIFEIFCLNKNLNINSSYGYNTFQSNISTNSIQIIDENGVCIMNDDGLVYSKIIENNSSINVIYDIDVNSNKFYNLIYLDCNSGSANYELILKKINNLNECIFYTRSDLANSGGLLILRDNESACVEINLDEFSSIKDLRNKNINRNNIYLPPLTEFYYDHCFELNKTNYIENKIQTGFWTSGQIQINDSGFCNYSMITDCFNADYLQYKSNIYNIKICNPENRINTNSIQDKSLFDTSDDFFIPRSNIECCFYFCNLEFRYSPVQSILYRDNYYSIPNQTIQINFSLSGNSEIVDFPLDAINYNKLKINTNYEIFETVRSSNIDINYIDFSFTKSCLDSNYICYQVPIIQLPNLNGYEYPQVLINNVTKQIKQTNIKFEINPLNKFSEDVFYGLNNFLFFINSKLKSGAALDFLNCQTILLDDYCYGCSDYNFLMMDLKSEYDSDPSIIPTGDWYNILELVSLEDGENLISYKNNTGNGYNYISAVITGINYCDQFSGDYLTCSEINASGLLNYTSTGFNYDGSSRSIRYLFDESQNITGCFISIDSGSFFSIENNSYFINLQSSDLTGQMKCRDINISKNYKFTGIQPFFIKANYPMLDIKKPMLCSNLKEYILNTNDQETSGLYYYTYDISNPKNIDLKLISPDFTYITNISWADKSIDPFSVDSKIGLIQNNSAKINLDISNLIYENPYFLNCEFIQTICINMIGGL
jgi:hypothetical protein